MVERVNIRMSTATPTPGTLRSPSAPSRSHGPLGRRVSCLVLLTIPMLSASLLSSCSSAHGSSASSTSHVASPPYDFAGAATDADLQTTQALNAVSAAAESCPTTQDPQACLSTAAASGETQIIHVISSLQADPRFPPTAQNAYTYYISILGNLRVEMHEMAVGNSIIQDEVLSSTLPTASQEYLSIYHVLSLELGYKAA